MTGDYTVVMSVVSIRFSDEPVHSKLKEHAKRRRVSLSSVAERLIDEGLRAEANPSVIFRDGPAGRRPVLIGGPEVADVVGAIVGGDVPVEERRERAAQLMGLSLAQIDAALAYYADYSDEIDTWLGERAEAAAQAEAAWQRQQEVLSR